MSRVLVTGASGFIGWFAIRALAETGFEVHATGRAKPAGLPSGVGFHAADLLSPGGPESLIEATRASHLLHLAWNAQPGEFWWARDNLDWLSASLRLYRAFAAAGGKRAVFAGSCAEYDWAAPLLSERGTALNPRTLYGTCKHALRLVVEQAAERDGVSIAWGRLFWLYGPREKPGRLISDVIAGLLRGREVRCTQGTQRRDFMHVEDAATAFARLLESDWEGAVNIASGRAVSIAEMISSITALLGRDELVRLGELSAAPDEPFELVADVSVLRDHLGFTPRYSLQDGLKSAVAWWRAHLTP